MTFPFSFKLANDTHITDYDIVLSIVPLKWLNCFVGSFKILSYFIRVSLIKLCPRECQYEYHNEAVKLQSREIRTEDDVGTRTIIHDIFSKYAKSLVWMFLFSTVFTEVSVKEFLASFCFNRPLTRLPRVKSCPGWNLERYRFFKLNEICRNNVASKFRVRFARRSFYSRELT